MGRDAASASCRPAQAARSNRSTCGREPAT